MQTYALIIKHKNIRDRRQGDVTDGKGVGRMEGNWDEWKEIGTDDIWICRQECLFLRNGITIKNNCNGNKHQSDQLLLGPLEVIER